GEMALGRLAVGHEGLIWPRIPLALEFGGNQGGITQKGGKLLPDPGFDGYSRHPLPPAWPARLFPCGAAICSVAPPFSTSPHSPHWQATDSTHDAPTQQIGSSLVPGISTRVARTPLLRVCPELRGDNRGCRPLGEPDPFRFGA